MDSLFHDLPPLKRFKLMQQQEEGKSTDLAPKIQENGAIPLCLPAKKRKQCREENDAGNPTTYCLPAKKRIWAIPPIDLNLECQQAPSQESLLSQEMNIHVKSPPGESQVEDVGIPMAYSLPAKKRIFAIPPIDLNQQALSHELLLSQEMKIHVKPPPGESQEEEEEVDDGILCAVCGSTDGDPTDPIVLCDGCDLMVHASCYGHPFTQGIPEGDWYCAQCLTLKSGQETRVSCCLCPVLGGALKPTTDGKWAHLVCAIYVPEVFFLDSSGREGIDCSKVLKRRWEQKCYICHESKNGCVVDCSEPKCRLAFHVTCGLREELCIEYRLGKSKGCGGVVAAFCSAHTELWKKQEQTGKFKIVARE